MAVVLGPDMSEPVRGMAGATGRKDREAVVVFPLKADRCPAAKKAGGVLSVRDFMGEIVLWKVMPVPPQG